MDAGGGPSSLPQPGPAEGRVRGRVLRGGAPAAGALVELCESALDDGGWLCDDGAGQTYRSTKTRADGTFDLWEVPPGRYDFAVSPSRSGADRQVLENRCYTTTPDGPTYRAVELELSAP